MCEASHIADMLKNPTVLIVDDEIAVARLAHGMLQAAEFNVITANSAEEAKRQYAFYRDSIEVLITDVCMPDQSGPDLADELTGFNPGLNVLLVSGYCDSCQVQRFPFLRKPFSAGELIERVRAFSRGRRLFSAKF
jgi:DNA-binding NtrC family response regulator